MTGCRGLRNTKLALQLLERDPFGFRIDEQHHKELQRRHGRKKGEGQPPGILCKNGKQKRDDCVHDPVRRRAQALALGADTVGKHLRDVNPDDRAL